MTRWQRLARIFQTLARNPEALKRVISEVEEKRAYVQKHLGMKDGLPTIDLLDLVPGLHDTVKPYSFLEGTSTVIDIALLVALAKQRRDCRYLEIGTWRGESVANVARHAAHCVSISLSDAEMRNMGFSEANIRAHRFYSRDLSNVQHIAHNSQTFDFRTLGEGFDLIFIDADHSYDSVRMDTENAFRLLRNHDSVIVWHDYGETPETVRWDVLAGILDGSPREHRDSIYHVSNTLCAIFTRSSYRSMIPEFPATPDKVFEVSISVRRL